MISNEMQELYNQLIQVDFNSAFLYLSLANYFERQNLTGMSQWLRAQYNEELTHALSLNDTLLARGGTVELKGVTSQPINFGSVKEAWQYVLEHEQMVTDIYKNALNLARRYNDPQSESIFQLFLVEQIDEVAQATTIIGRLNLTNGNQAAILFIDNELSQKVK